MDGLIFFINALANERYALYRNNKGSFEYVTGTSQVGVITTLPSGWGHEIYGLRQRRVERLVCRSRPCH